MGWCRLIQREWACVPCDPFCNLSWKTRRPGEEELIMLELVSVKHLEEYWLCYETILWWVVPGWTPDAHQRQTREIKYNEKLMAGDKSRVRSLTSYCHGLGENINLLPNKSEQDEEK